MSVRLRILLVVGVSCLVPLAGCSQGEAETTAKAEAGPKVVPVTVAALEHRTVERTVDVVGSLRGWEDVTVGTKREGRVLKVLHDMGDRIEPGQPMVLLDPIDADLAVRQSQRQLQAELAKLGLKDLPQGEFDVSRIPAVVQARVALERASQNHARERSLTIRHAGTAQDLQNAENDEHAAQAALENAILNARATLANAHASRAALDVAEQGRRETEIRAPVPSKRPPGVTSTFSYALAKRSVAEGQILRPGDAVAELVIDNPLKLWANVPERFGPDVAVGQPVRVSAASQPGMTFDAKVARINPSVDPVSRTFQVEVSIPNNRGLLRPGGFAKASILTDRNAQTAVVPLESVVRYAGVTKVFVVEGGKARAINIETGQEGRDWVEVIGTLPKEAKVVTTGQTQLADGTLVTVRVPERAKAVEAQGIDRTLNR